MNHQRTSFFYGLMMLIVLIVLYFISVRSTQIAPIPTENTIGLAESFNTFLGFVRHHLTSQFGLLLAQIIIILVFARCVAWCFTKLRQPSVIGEILAGIILGPSAFGLLAPDLFHTIFPPESLYNISLLSQFGLIFFMFVIGMELDISEIRKRLKQTFIISHAGIVIPFVLGALTALWLFDEYSTPTAHLLPFALFIGISMSITAFPVLARIIQEKGKMHTHIGVLSLATAANGDITAWCLIAVIMAIAQAGSAMSALFTILFAAGYMLLMFLVARPIFAAVGRLYNNSEVLSKGVIAAIFLTLLLSAYTTEVLGLHALFGAFVAGVVMPDNMKFRRLLTERVEDVSLSIFLPLFFVSSGLQTQIGLLNTPKHWIIAIAITLIAILGKLGGTYVAARVVGETKRDSLYMGILMNTRGLMELVVLSMGYQLGILSPVIYAMLVLMTLITTFMTTPLIGLLNTYYSKRERIKKVSTVGQPRLHLLFSFGRRSMGHVMLCISKGFATRQDKDTLVTALHMTVGSEVNPMNAQHFKDNAFDRLLEQSEKMALEIVPRYEITDNPIQTLLSVTKECNADLLLIGAPIDLSQIPTDLAKRQLVTGVVGNTLTTAGAFFNVAQMLRDKTAYLIQHAPCSLGVVIDKGLQQPPSMISICLEEGGEEGTSSFERACDYYLENSIATISKHTYNDGAPLAASDADLLIIDYTFFKRLIADTPELLQSIPTTILLYIKQK